MAHLGHPLEDVAWFCAFLYHIHPVFTEAHTWGCPRAREFWPSSTKGGTSSPHVSYTGRAAESRGGGGEGGRRVVVKIFLGGGGPPGPENPYPISDQNIRFSIPYVKPDSQNVYPISDPVMCGKFGNSQYVFGVFGTPQTMFVLYVPSHPHSITYILPPFPPPPPRPSPCEQRKLVGQQLRFAMSIRIQYISVVPNVKGRSRGYITQASRQKSFLLISAGKFPPEEELLRLYCEKRGIPHPPPNWNYFLVFACFRFAQSIQVPHSCFVRLIKFP